MGSIYWIRGFYHTPHHPEEAGIIIIEYGVLNIE